MRSRLDLSQFSRVKHIVRFSDWLELIFVRKFTTKLLSKYISVCIKQIRNYFASVTCIAKFCLLLLLLLLFFFIGKRLLGFWLVTFHEPGACEHPKNHLAKNVGVEAQLSIIII